MHISVANEFIYTHEIALWRIWFVLTSGMLPLDIGYLFFIQKLYRIIGYEVFDTIMREKSTLKNFHSVHGHR